MGLVEKTLEDVVCVVDITNEFYVVLSLLSMDRLVLPSI